MRDRWNIARALITLILGFSGVFLSSLATYGLVPVAPRIVAPVWAGILAAAAIWFYCAAPTQRVKWFLIRTFRLRRGWLEGRRIASASLGVVLSMLALAFFLGHMLGIGAAPDASAADELAGRDLYGWQWHSPWSA